MTTLELFLGLHYPVYIYPDRCTDGSFCYVAEHPDLPGCAAYGPAIEEARAALTAARITYIAHVFSSGGLPPMPQDTPGLEWRSSNDAVEPPLKVVEQVA